MMARLRFWLSNRVPDWMPDWRWLPDRCRMDGCERQGVRGNENVVSGITMCDYCHVKRLHGEYPPRRKRWIR